MFGRRLGGSRREGVGVHGEHRWLGQRPLMPCGEEGKHSDRQDPGIRQHRGTAPR